MIIEDKIIHGYLILAMTDVTYFKLISNHHRSLKIDSFTILLLK